MMGRFVGGHRVWFSLVVMFLAWVVSGQPAKGDDWPQWLGPKRDGVWRETGIIENFPATGANFRWRVPVGAGYSGPAVANGRVFLTDRHLSNPAKIPADPFQTGTIPGPE